MKKIDTWLSIQRFVSEAASVPLPSIPAELEIVGRPRRSHFRSRRLIKLTHQSV